MSQWIGTANQGYAPYAMDEIRKALPGCGFKPLAPGEVFWMECPLDREDALQAIHAGELAFLRHIQPVDWVVAQEEQQEHEGQQQEPPDFLESLAVLIRQHAAVFAGKKTAVHLRKSKVSDYPYGAAETKAALDSVLEEVGAFPDVQKPELVISLYAAGNHVFAGIASPADMLSDWPGGAVRFQREEGQISRAKFKLLEAERAFGLDYADFKRAIDIGAAPGGWTSLLLERGLRVTAVDPAEMHPALQSHPALNHLKKNASEIKLDKGAYDLLVCDMSWSPMLMSRLVLDLKDALAPGAKAVITVKLMHRKPLQSIREVKERLGTGFVIHRTKQLFHNREEVTLYAEKK